MTNCLTMDQSYDSLIKSDLQPLLKLQRSHTLYSYVVTIQGLDSWLALMLVVVTLSQFVTFPAGFRQGKTIADLLNDCVIYLTREVKMVIKSDLVT